MQQPFQHDSFLTGQNLEHLFSQAPAPIAIYQGRELKYIFINEAYSRIFNGRDIVGKTLREAFPELAGQGYYEILEGVYETGIPYQADETPAQIDLHGDGRLTTRYYNLIYTPYRNTEGITEGVMAFGHDVTQQVVARKKAEETDQRFRNVVEQAPYPILILKGADMVLDAANEPLLQLWQVGPEAIGKPFLEILPEMEDQGIMTMLREVLQLGINQYGYEMPVVFERKNGIREEVYFNFVYAPYREADGRVTGIIVIASDVSDQVSVRKQLVESEQNFRNLIMQAPLGIAILKGPELVLELANETYFGQAGKIREEMIGRSVWESMPEIRNGFEPILKEVMRTGIPYHGIDHEVRMLRNGVEEVFYIDFVYQPMRGVDGAVNGIMSIGTDVTDKVMARKRIEDSEKELQQRVAERTAELEKKNSELEQFAFVASHDLQEPLRKIRAFGEILKSRYGVVLGEEGEDLISRMQSAAERMRMLIHALLSYSRVSAEGERYYTVPLQALLREVIGDLETAIEEKDARLTVDDLQPVKGDPLQLRQLFQNLLSNALKFSKPGQPPEIRVSSRLLTGKDAGFQQSVPATATYQLIEVTDNGIGFEPRYSDKIFQIFQRLHGKSEYPGSGVGLSIVRKVVTNHGGFVEVQSELGQGATFRVLLPAD